jgi:F-type H+-transporting ATPase subunit b
MAPFQFIAAANPIAISIPTLVIELILFLGMIWVLNRLVFNPIRSAWQRRQAEIEEGNRAALTAREEAEAARAEVVRILQEARAESQAAINAAMVEAERLRAQYIEEATAEFRRLVNEARAQIQAELEQASAQLRERIIDLALEAASRVTGRSYATPEVRQLAASIVREEGWKLSDVTHLGVR